MITLLTGDNSYEIERELKVLVAGFDGEPEKLDGAGLELRQLPDVLSGQSLFSEKRLVVLRELSANKPLWEVLPDLLERMSDDIHLVLVDASPDKRTRTYKALQKVAEVKAFQLRGERDSAQAQRWLIDEAKRMDMQLDTAAARELLRRSLVVSPKGQPVIDQWQANHALEKLSAFKEVTAETVQKYIDDQPLNTVFSIFETALKGDGSRLQSLLKDLDSREDPFRVFGLLSGQVFQLAALSVSDTSSAETAKAIGSHPFAVGKLAEYAKRLDKRGVREIVTAFTEADEDMKLSKAEPWVLIERALIKTVKVAKDI